jgi:peptide/nickel transport system substrate-binding protein
MGRTEELDVIEAYAQCRISRRDFVKRGAIIGLSTPFMGAIAACGSDGDGETTATTPEGATTAAGGGASGGNLIVGIQQGDSSTGLDPVNMLEVGTYGVTSQSFEYLVGLGADGNIDATALATGWSPNETGDQWTLDLRQGAKWQDGSDFTSADWGRDVANTYDRRRSW